MVAVNVIAADDDATARRLFTSAQQAFTNVSAAAGAAPASRRRHRGVLVSREKARVANVLSRSYVGSPTPCGRASNRSSPRPRRTS